ncbi:hypothetical protein K505DRAFT_330075, partial [Melanomma pulvis-pyrius CBS 109.77]
KTNQTSLTFVPDTADASDHEAAAQAIAAGLASGHTAQRPGFWLHTGGTGILCWEDMQHGRLGERTEKEYNDWTDVSSLTHLPASAFHRNVDQLVLEAGAKNPAAVKTAIVCPPTIYGPGRGPSNARSRQAYELAKFVLAERRVPIIGAGAAQWNNIHVADLADVFILLVEAAVARNLDPELWGAEKGYYLVENGEHVWAGVARLMGEKAVELGFLDEGVEEVRLEREAAEELAGFEAVSWGLNSRGRAERARRVLGWRPYRKSLEDEVEGILRSERERLG